MHRSENWDDLRFVLRVAREGSVSAAARSLGVNHATVLRRVAAVERRYDLGIFDKSLHGYKVAASHGRIIEAIGEIETAVLGLERAVKGLQAPLRGVVRLTATDTFCHAILPQIIQSFHQSSQELRIELVNSNQQLDLGRLDADLTIRLTDFLPEDLDGERAGEMGFGTYAARGSRPNAWIGLSGAIARSKPANWMVATLGGTDMAVTADSFLTARELAAAGLGAAALPVVLGDQDTRLARVDMGMPAMAVQIWVASHIDLMRVPRIRAVRAFVVRALSENGPYLRGSPREA